KGNAHPQQEDAKAKRGGSHGGGGGTKYGFMVRAVGLMASAAAPALPSSVSTPARRRTLWRTRRSSRRCRRPQRRFSWLTVAL
ncbi:MAG: hypothetical protein ACOVOG_16385, partial [Rubrivivax sp.]